MSQLRTISAGSARFTSGRLFIARRGGHRSSREDRCDIAEVAALELIRRDTAKATLPLETINLVGPGTLTGEAVAAIWSEVLDRPVVYGGDDPSGFEANMATFMPK